MSDDAMTGAEFKAQVTKHLRTMLKLVPDFVPDDIDDSRIKKFTDAHGLLDELLYGLGYEKRHAEHQETERARRIAAKEKRPDLEDIITRLDQRTQRLAQMGGLDRQSAQFLAPMAVCLFLTTAIQLLETVPPCAFLEPIVPPGFDEDPTVKAMFEIMRHRVAQAGVPTI